MFTIHTWNRTFFVNFSLKCLSLKLNYVPTALTKSQLCSSLRASRPRGHSQSFFCIRSMPRGCESRDSRLAQGCARESSGEGEVRPPHFPTSLGKFARAGTRQVTGYRLPVKPRLRYRQFVYNVVVETYCLRKYKY